MALPSTNDLSLWSGNKFTNTQWDANATKLIQFLSSGTWDLKINNLECNDIDASSINVNITNGIPVGMSIEMQTTTAPSGFLYNDGANHLITNYPALFLATGHTHGFGDSVLTTPTSVTDTNNVATVTANAHGRSNGDYISVRWTDSASGKIINRGTQVENASTNAFEFSTSGWTEKPANPMTYRYGTTFPVQDRRGYGIRGVDPTSTIDPDSASRTNRGDGATGDQPFTLQEDQFKNHTHNFIYYDGSSSLELAPPNTNNNGQGLGLYKGGSVISSTYGPRVMIETPTINDLGSTNGYIYNPSGTAVARFYNSGSGENQTNMANFSVYWYVKY